MSSAVTLKIYVITVGIKKYKSIIKKKKHDKIVLLANFKYTYQKLNRALIDSYVSHDDFALVNNVVIK